MFACIKQHGKKIRPHYYLADKRGNIARKETGKCWGKYIYLLHLSVQNNKI